MKINLWFLFGLSVIGLNAVTSLGQDEQIETTGETTEMTVIAAEGGGAPMIFATSETFDGNGSSGSAIRMFAPTAGGMGAFMGSPIASAPDPYSLLGNPSVQKDLELVGDQLKQVQDMQAEFSRRIKEQIGDLSKGGIGPDRFKGIGEVIRKLKQEQQSQLDGLLLPHQLDRLKQVALQTHMQQAGTENALASDKVAEALNISDQQKDRLKSRAKEIKDQLAKDIEKLKEKAKDELLMELTPDQRSKLKTMTGEKYTPQTKDWEEMLKGARRKIRRPGANQKDRD